MSLKTRVFAVSPSVQFMQIQEQQFQKFIAHFSNAHWTQSAAMQLYVYYYMYWYYNYMYYTL